MTDSELLSIKQRFSIIGNSPKLNHAIQVAMQVSSTDMTVLITGESGSGKESFSKIIHQLSARKHNQFIAINCGAIPEGTIDSELFGHEKGSFTGAHDARKGYFEVTNGGTIFLDEIGEMPMGTQARLLRVLENGEYIKVGSSKVNKTSVRVIAATNVNLIEAVQRGKFREDLYYRLNTVPIFVPPLRERGTDVDLLFRKFAGDFSDKYRVKPIKLTDGAKTLLLSYRFPGNIRQLRNIVDQISVLEIDREIDKEKLAGYLPANHSSSLPTLLSGNNGNNSNDFSEREILYKVLFDMKKDMTELKKLVLDLMQNKSSSSQIMNEHKDLFQNIENTSFESKSENRLLLDSYERLRVMDKEEHEHDDDLHDAELITHEFEDETLSIESKEKELIKKALKKHNNKRKYAAQDLGISERTLYRKIKQYDLQ